MADEKEKLAFWLMPANDVKPFFVSLVDDLAQRFDAPRFEPHVTLQGAELERQRAIELLENIAAQAEPLELQVSGIEYSNKYTKTLYVQFNPSADACAISDQLADAVRSDSGYEFDPHLSLLYKTMPEMQKQELAREIKLPFDHVRFNAVKLVSVPRAIEVAEDVHAWRSIAERPLGSTSK